MDFYNKIVEMKNNNDEMVNLKYGLMTRYVGCHFIIFFSLFLFVCFRFSMWRLILAKVKK